MKKRICIVLSLFCLSFVLSCGGDYVGTYKTTYSESIASPLVFTVTLKLKSNGGFTAEKSFDSVSLETISGTYEVNNDSLTIYFVDSKTDSSTEISAKGTISKNKIKIKLFGQQLTFSKS